MGKMNFWEFMNDSVFFVCIAFLCLVYAVQDGCTTALKTDAYNRCIEATKDAAACSNAKDGR